MKILRLVLGVLLVVWTVMNAIAFAAMVGVKLGWLTEVPNELDRMVPLFETTPWWMAGMWAAYLAFMLMAAWGLLRDGKALPPYAFGLLVNVALWWSMSLLPVYDQVFTPAEMRADYYIFAGQIVFALLVWLTERRRRGLSRPDL